MWFLIGEVLDLCGIIYTHGFWVAGWSEPLEVDDDDSRKTVHSRCLTVQRVLVTFVARFFNVLTDKMLRNRRLNTGGRIGHSQ